MTRLLGQAELLRIATDAPRVDKLLPEVKPDVDTWVWTRPHSPRSRLAPHAMERLGLEPGADYRREPRRRAGAEAYGYDAQGRLILSHRFIDQEMNEVQVWHYEPNTVRELWFYSTGELQQLTHYVCAEDGQASCAERARPGRDWLYLTERYRYGAAGQLELVEFARIDRDREVQGVEGPENGVQRLTYDGDRLVSVVTEYASGRSQLTFAPIDEAPAELASRALPGIVDAIRRAASTSDDADAWCMLAVRYVTGGVLLPPIVNVCHDRDWPELARSADPSYALNPAEWNDSELVLELDDATAVACEKLERTLAQGSSAPAGLARDLALTLVSRLSSENWSATRPVTEDFLVYAVDVDLADLERNLAGSAKCRQRSLLA